MAVGLKLAPVNLDIRHQSGSALEQILIGNVYEGLVSRGSDNKVHPGLAKSWEISKDGLTYTFHLNEKMNFSNGDKLDAEDVAWSINELKAQKYYDYEQVKSLDKAEAVDANTVRLTLSAPNSNMLWYLTSRPGLVYDKDATWIRRTARWARVRTPWSPSTRTTRSCSRRTPSIGAPSTRRGPRT